MHERRRRRRWIGVAGVAAIALVASLTIWYYSDLPAMYPCDHPSDGPFNEPGTCEAALVQFLGVNDNGRIACTVLAEDESRYPLGDGLSGGRFRGPECPSEWDPVWEDRGAGLPVLGACAWIGFAGLNQDGLPRYFVVEWAGCPELPAGASFGIDRPLVRRRSRGGRYQLSDFGLESSETRVRTGRNRS